MGRFLSGFFFLLLPEPRVAGTLHQILHDPFPEEVGEGHPIDLGLSVAFSKRVGVWLSDKDEIALFGRQHHLVPIDHKDLARLITD